MLPKSSPPLTPLLKPLLKPRQAPPAHYYADNVQRIIEQTQLRYADVLPDAMTATLQGYLNCSEQAQRLLVRLHSRQGPWFRIEQLSYQEVDDVDACIAELAHHALVSTKPSLGADTALHTLKAAELKSLFPKISERQGRLKKADFVTACVTSYSDQQILQRLTQQVSWVQLTCQQWLNWCEYLYFGTHAQDLSTFIMTDLGLLNFEQYQMLPGHRLFNSETELRQYQSISQLDAFSHRLDDFPQLSQWLLARLITIAQQNPKALPRASGRGFNKLCNRLGQWFERKDQLYQALTCYQHSQAHPARERRARILKKIDQVVASEQLVAEILDAPWSAAELSFAQRFPRKKGKTGTREDDGLISQIQLLATPKQRIEDFAVVCLTDPKGRAWHLENSFPLGLAGILYWDVLFAPIAGAFNNPYQAAPLDLFWDDFARARNHLIRQRTTELTQACKAGDGIAKAVWRIANAKQHITCRLVNWQAWQPELISEVLANVPHDKLVALAHYVINNLNFARNGFPDLLHISGPDDYEFVEVKSPNDQLQPAQRIWLKTLANLSMPVRVLKFKAAPEAS